MICDGVLWIEYLRVGFSRIEAGDVGKAPNIFSLLCKLEPNMPKERRDRSVSVDGCMISPLPSSPSHEGLYSSKISVQSKENIKEWEEARCAVCMEHPHNAVLLMCSSHERGCRPYMCNTSYRHSNCLDQFRKSFMKSTQMEAIPENQLLVGQASSAVVSEGSSSLQAVEGSSGLQSVVSEGSSGVQAESNEGGTVPVISSENQDLQKLVCPLCRGHIKEWIVVESARRFMNAKARSCACETCNFSGNYSDLRKHARLEHPRARPSEADPERQRNWRRLERRRDIGDLLSTLQSSFGEESGELSIVPEDGGWLTVYFLVRVVRPRNSPRMSTSRARSAISRTRLTRLWGESFDEENGSSPGEDNESSDVDSLINWRRRIRRRMSPDNQP